MTEAAREEQADEGAAAGSNYEPTEAQTGVDVPGEASASGEAGARKEKTHLCIGKEELPLWRERFAELKENLTDEQGKPLLQERRMKVVASLLEPDLPFLHGDAYTGRADNPPPPRLEILRDTEAIREVLSTFFVEQCAGGRCVQLLSHRAEHYLFRLDDQQKLRLVGVFDRATATLMEPTDNWKDVRAVHDAWVAAAKAFYGDIAPVRCGLGLEKEFETARVTGDKLIERSIGLSQ